MLECNIKEDSLSVQIDVGMRSKILILLEAGKAVSVWCFALFATCFLTSMAIFCLESFIVMSVPLLYPGTLPGPPLFILLPSFCVD